MSQEATFDRTVSSRETLLELFKFVAAGRIDEDDLKIEVSYDYQRDCFRIVFRDPVRWQVNNFTFKSLWAFDSAREQIDFVFGNCIRSWKKLNAPPRKPNVPEQYKDWY